ncbi:isocitrate/isopropylmalate dehydrogenase family protein [Rhodococcus sp. ABRD24]|uniref:isocitrate/isopropylmalate dehydrogenase family protein n=1 Tax=Rhodococcus sp. ABRD24 TaxID=2507582 RepID=UPI00103CF210|nr:isocitrate/isopropylmalate family dehydrogenase [Rhodococcus sp. ABRD24]QBJ96777.1 isocitrate/isopropylmalate dehydrogenase family protein [Rhodococcus sp. ABRD24]
MTPRLQLRIGVLPGDGIGPEIVPAAEIIIDAALAARSDVEITWQRLSIGHDAISKYGTPIPSATLEVLDELDAWILGPHDSASYPDPWRTQLTPGGTIRKRFGLFANIRPARALPGTTPVSPKMDLVVVRENTEGFYADRNMHAGSGEFMPTPDVAMAVGVVTRQACERIAHEAFRLARTRRRRVTIAHKANVLPMTMGLFLDTCLEVAEQYPDVTVDHQHIDALAALLVRHGDAFDVIVTENMFGDILSDLTGELAGSIGNAPSLNTSETKAMAQAAHGAAPDIAGLGIANPTAVILSSAMLLRCLGARHDHAVLSHTANKIETAVETVMGQGICTADLGGTASTARFVDAVVESVTCSSDRVQS